MVTLEDYTLSKPPSVALASIGDLRAALTSFAAKPPGVIQLTFAEGVELLVGIGGPFMMAQFTEADGDGPFLCAKAPVVQATADVEFDCGGTLSPIPPELCLSVDDGLKIVEYFFETGKRAPDFEWEMI